MKGSDRKSARGTAAQEADCVLDRKSSAYLFVSLFEMSSIAGGKLSLIA